jgi:hypothetical protein
MRTVRDPSVCGVAQIPNAEEPVSYFHFLYKRLFPAF